MYEKTEEGEEQKTIRIELNIGKEIFDTYNNEFTNDYITLENNNNAEYEAVMRQMFFDSVNREVAKNTFVEQGRIFVKQNVNETNKLHVQMKEYDSSLSARKTQLNYVENINGSLVNKEVVTTTDKIRYFYDYSNLETHPNLLREGSNGTEEEKKIYNIKPDSITSGTGVFGILNYNFTNSLYKGNEEERKLLNNIYFKENVLFQIKVNRKEVKILGPINLINKSDLSYVLTPYIKYSHGLVYTEDGKIKQSDYHGILYWFYKKQKEGKFVNIDEWDEIL